MQKICKQCGTPYEITQEDLAFYDKISPIFNGKKELIPPPTLCPSCRVQRRFTQRNENFLHRRTCDLTGKSIISFYAPDAPYKVFDRDAWWSDRWNGLSYGRSFNFSRPFFEQFAALRQAVPRLGMVMTQSEGSFFSPYCVETKNCYMCVSCLESEDCYYCYQTNRSQNCVDCAHLRFCELAYECLYCFSLNASAFCRDCENGNGLFFCQDCRGCTDCIGCKNLANKKNCILNRQATQEEVTALRQDLTSYAKRHAFEEEYRSLSLSLPTRGAHLTQCEHCTGDHLRECRNCSDCFDSGSMEDCAHAFPIPSGAKDCQDLHYSPSAELVYDSLSAVRANTSRFVLHSWDVSEATYTDECFSSKYLFGCIGLRHKEYCILNKQYTKEEYEELVPRMIAHMRSTEEWGEFFPIKLSPFAYNESIAYDDFPLIKEEVLKRGWEWREKKDEMPKVSKIIPAKKLPDVTGDVPDAIVDWAIECEATKRPFRIIRQELNFYRTMELSVPHFHPDERHKRRMALRNPRKLWNRQCAKCQKTIATSYSPERPEIIYCEECYLKEVY